MFLPAFSEDIHFSVNLLPINTLGAMPPKHAPLITELLLNPIKLRVQANSPLELCWLKKVWLLCLGQAALLGIGRQGTGRMGVNYGTPWERKVWRAGQHSSGYAMILWCSLRNNHSCADGWFASMSWFCCTRWQAEMPAAMATFQLVLLGLTFLWASRPWRYKITSQYVLAVRKEGRGWCLWQVSLSYSAQALVSFVPLPSLFGPDMLPSSCLATSPVRLHPGINCCYARERFRSSLFPAF